MFRAPVLKRCFATGSDATKQAVKIKAAILLTRQPIITPTLNEFEEAFYNYQSSLERRLMWTFPQYYHFKKGSLSERRFTKAQKGPVSRQPGVFYEKGIPNVVHNRERREAQSVIIPKDEYEEGMSSEISRPVVPNSRRTTADEKNDVKSLERALDRSLYLLVKGPNGWRLPSFDVQEGDNALHRRAEDGLREIGGDKVNTWTVARKPAAVLKDGDVREFVIKSHILSGEVVPNSDYAWVNREEVENLVGNDYFGKIEFLFSRV